MTDIPVLPSKKPELPKYRIGEEVLVAVGETYVVVLVNYVLWSAPKGIWFYVFAGADNKPLLNLVTEKVLEVEERKVFAVPPKRKTYA